jgi:hypothetical protein
MDGIQVPQALLGVPRPIDPGAHKFQAFADGMQSAASTLEVGEGRNETVVLTLQPMPSGTAPAPMPAMQGDAPPPGGPGPTPPEQDSGGANGLRIGGYVALGVGVVGLGLGTLFALQAKSKVDDANDICGGSGDECRITNPSQESQVSSLDDDARSATTLSIVSFVVGGLGAATGITLLVLSSGRESDGQAALSVAPYVGPGSAGVTGRF